MVRPYHVLHCISVCRSLKKKKKSNMFYNTCMIEEREVSWSRKHPIRAGPSRWRGCNHRCHDNLRQEWPTPWTQSLLITLPKKDNLQQRQNYPSKVMLKIILNRLKPQAKKIIAKEQAGFRAGRSTTEQISPAQARPLSCLQRIQEGL